MGLWHGLSKKDECHSKKGQTIDKVQTTGFQNEGKKSSQYNRGNYSDLHKMKNTNIAGINYCIKKVKSQNNIGQRAQELWYTSENGFLTCQDKLCF